MARLIVALDIGAKQVRMAALSLAGKETEIVRVGEQPVLPEEGPKPAVDRLLADPRSAEAAFREAEQLLQQPRSVVLKRRPELALQSGEIADALSAELA